MWTIVHKLQLIICWKLKIQIVNITYEHDGNHYSRLKELKIN